METSEILMSIGQVLMWISLAVLAFNLLVLWWVRRIESRIVEELGEIAQDLEAEKLIALTVEVDGDQFLCYNAQTKSAAIYNGDESAVRVLRTQLNELKKEQSLT